MQMLSKVLILVILLNFSTAHAFDAVNFSEEDKGMHAGMSYNLAAATTMTLQNNGFSNLTSSLLSGGMVMLVGIFKEYAIDASADTKDIQANLAGTALGMTIPFRIEF